MIEKEVSEIRRRFRSEQNNITHILGCYVNERKEIISKFTKPMSMMKEVETEMFLSLIKKALSGTIGKNLIDLEFTTDQVVSSPEHKLLMELRKTELKNDEQVDRLYEKIVDSLIMETSYLILLAFDKYDITFKSKNDESFSQASSEVFNYFICCICPVKETKASISYNFEEELFKSTKGNYSALSPSYGFMFPSFEDRTTNIYHSIYYTKNFDNEEFSNSVFGLDLPMMACVQKETFQNILTETLEEECDLELVQTIHDKFSEMIETHKVNKEVEPLFVSKNQVKNILEDCGVTDEKVDNFDEKFDEEFGSDTEIRPRNLVNTKQFDIATPNISIKVTPEQNSKIKTQIIDGKKYLLIDVSDGVEVNGINIQIK
ncbi:MAG: DUF4317 domain-containing protein [Clostridia bacterium]